jgi:hypothetical protein
VAFRSVAIVQMSCCCCECASHVHAHSVSVMVCTFLMRCCAQCAFVVVNVGTHQASHHGGAQGFPRFKSRLEYAENIRGMKVLYGWMQPRECEMRWMVRSAHGSIQSIVCRANVWTDIVIRCESVVVWVTNEPSLDMTKVIHNLSWRVSVISWVCSECHDMLRIDSKF